MIISFFRADACAFRARSLAPVCPSSVCAWGQSANCLGLCIKAPATAGSQLAWHLPRESPQPLPAGSLPEDSLWPQLEDSTGVAQAASINLLPLVHVSPRPALRQKKGVCQVAGCESGSCSSLQGKISSICFSWELVRCLICFCYSPAHRLH